jgi:hypothetical protein
MYKLSGKNQHFAYSEWHIRYCHLCVCDIQIARPCGFGAKWRNNKVSLRGVGKSRADFFFKK